MVMTPEDLAILVPMLGRAHRVSPLLESIDTTTPGCRVLFLLTPGDYAVLAAVKDAGREYLTVDRQPYGDYARKINTGYRNTTEPLLFTAADDLHFHPGWFEVATAELRPGIGVVGTNDLGNPRVLSGQHATHFLVARWYADLGTIDQPRAIFHEGYPHEFVDDELIGTARLRNAFAMAMGSHVEHLHPDYGKAPSDAMYSEQGQRMRKGSARFKSRRRMWT